MIASLQIPAGADACVAKFNCTSVTIVFYCHKEPLPDQPEQSFDIENSPESRGQFIESLRETLAAKGLRPQNHEKTGPAFRAFRINTS